METLSGKVIEERQLAERMRNPLAQQSPQVMLFGAPEVDIIKKVLCPGITDPELKLFVMYCKKTGLDPFAKQIHAVKRSPTTPMTIQIGIDGFRAKAEETGLYRGQLGPLWCGEDGQWCEVWLKDGHPKAAKVAVLREGFEPIWCVARWDTYVQLKQNGQVNFFWRKMGDNQLAKCAEALSFRKTYPGVFGGIYCNAEMEQADNPIYATQPQRRPSQETRKTTATEAPATPPKQETLVDLSAEIEQMSDLASQIGLTKEKKMEIMKGLGIHKQSDLTKETASAMLAELEDMAFEQANQKITNPPQEEERTYPLPEMDADCKWLAEIVPPEILPHELCGFSWLHVAEDVTRMWIGQSGKTFSGGGRQWLHVMENVTEDQQLKTICHAVLELVPSPNAEKREEAAAKKKKGRKKKED